jgi:hypothetical protein
VQLIQQLTLKKLLTLSITHLQNFEVKILSPIILALCAFSLPVQAEQDTTVQNTTSTQTSEKTQVKDENCYCGVWGNVGMISHHIKNTAPRNNENSGLGIEIPINSLISVTTGQYYNSDWKTTHYVGVYVLPFQLGSARFGAAVGGFDGYPNYKNGAWFPAAIPAMAIEGKKWGLNVIYIPGVSDRIQSVLSFQIKYRFEP